MATREAVVKTLAVFGALFPRDISPELVSIYHAALSDVSDDDLKLAMGKCVQTARFFPQPAELRDKVGANVKALPDMSAIHARLRSLVFVTGRSEDLPSVEKVRAHCGDAIASAYGLVGPKRLEGFVFDGTGVGTDIAVREFAKAIADAQESGQDIALPPLPQVKQLGNASQSLFVDGAAPERGFQRLGAGNL